MNVLNKEINPKTQIENHWNHSHYLFASPQVDYAANQLVREFPLYRVLVILLQDAEIDPLYVA